MLHSTAPLEMKRILNRIMCHSSAFSLTGRLFNPYESNKHDIQPLLVVLKMIGISGKDFVLSASDAVFTRSILMMKQGEDKSRQLNKNTLLLYSGESGDTAQFAEYIQKNISLYTIRNSQDLSIPAVAHFTRREMADSLRTKVASLSD